MVFRDLLRRTRGDELRVLLRDRLYENNSYKNYIIMINSIKGEKIHPIRLEHHIKLNIFNT